MDFMTDDELVKLAVDGSKEAYEVLFLRYKRKVSSMLYFYISEPEVIFDLTQEVMLKVYEYLGDFRQESQFSTWLHVIVLNVIKNHYRDDENKSRFELQYNHLPRPFFSNPEYESIGIELEERAEEALSRLPAKLRFCYGLMMIYGSSYEEIAETLHCPVGTVRSRIHRARQLLIASMKTIPNSN